MRNLVFLCFCLAVVFGISSCSKNVPEGSYANEGDSIPASQNLMNSASGVVTEETSLNIIAIATPQGDTMRFNKGNAVVEGSGVIVGDSAVVYYFFEAVADSSGVNNPVVSKIVTKTTRNKK